jgi:hypothetical protein
MKIDVKLKISKETSIESIDKQINLLRSIEDVNKIKQELNNISKNVSDILDSRDIIDKLKLKCLYQENEYSKDKTKNSILDARDRAIGFLEEIVDDIKSDLNKSIDTNSDFSLEIALGIIRKILNNFYMHLETMYESHVHGKAGITKDNLDKIKIANEYDVQRILYSLIKPIFPEARVEVSNDTGYGTIRYDIFIEKFDAVIEVKCSRPSMTEKSLTEELGSDIFHYKYSNIFFFIYDKEKVIRNSTSFINTYNGSFDRKNIEIILIQPINL